MDNIDASRLEYSYAFLDYFKHILTLRPDFGSDDHLNNMDDIRAVIDHNTILFEQWTAKVREQFPENRFKINCQGTGVLWHVGFHSEKEAILAKLLFDA